MVPVPVLLSRPMAPLLKTPSQLVLAIVPLLFNSVMVPALLMVSMLFEVS